MPPLRVTIWNEYLHELQHEVVGAHYPDGIHGALAEVVRQHHGDAVIRTATLRERDHGLSAELLDTTDVLLWWGHQAHDEVGEEWVSRVHQAVLSGMGFVALHSAHFAKPFIRLMGTNCSLRWREADERERLWSIEPGHPILAGVPDRFELEHEEMYGERFDIPQPDETLMLSWFQGGDVFRSLCTWRRGHGRVVYFRPGHETYPTYRDPHVGRIIANAAEWARRRVTRPTELAPRVEALERVPNPTKEHI